MSLSELPSKAHLKVDLKISKAVCKNPILYDRTNENYRKRLPSENSWDIVASEVGETVTYIKRRWRQIRNDYVRWLAQEEKRRRTNQKSSPFYLAEELKFLTPHVMPAEGGWVVDEYDRDTSSSERRQVGTPTQTVAAGAYNAELQAVGESFDQQPSTKTKQAGELNNNKAAEPVELQPAIIAPIAEQHNDNNVQEVNPGYTSTDDEGNSSTPNKEHQTKKLNTPEPEFFIKQSTGSAVSLIIKKKTFNTPLEPMEAPTEAVHVRSVGRPRRVARESSGSIKQLPIHKPEPRVTRLQRRKSMCLAAVNSVRSSTSPVKMAAVPKVPQQQQQHKQPLQQQQHKQPLQQQQHKQPLQQQQQQPLQQQPKQTAAKAASGFTTPQQRGLVQLAGGDNTMPRSAPAGTRIFPPRRESTCIRLVNAVSTSASTPTARPAVTVSSTRTPSAENSAVRVPQRNSNTGAIAAVDPLKLDAATTVNLSPNVTAISSTTTCSTSVAKTNVVPPGALISLAGYSKKSTTTVSTQAECQDTYSDEHFLDSLEPQMRVMNSRQKMMFKTKVYQSLMEVFDDGNDFPGAGEVQQHLNINTPSDFEHVSNQELRLIRELVCVVRASKSTLDVMRTSGTTTTPVSRPAANHSRDELGLPRHIIQRFYKPNTATTPNSTVASNTGTIIEGTDKRFYRILQMSGGKVTNGSPPTAQPKDNADSASSNAVSSTINTNRVNTFVIPNTNKMPASLPETSANALSAFFGPTMPAPSVSNTVAAKNLTILNPNLQVRPLGRRYSICGSVDPNSLKDPFDVNANRARAAAELDTNVPKRSLTAAELEKSSLLKRRLAVTPQSPIPQQRPRLSNNTNSMLIKPVATKTLTQQQDAPTGQATQKTPQISSVSGASCGSFAFATPAAGPSRVSSISPAKRSLIIANPKTNTKVAAAANGARPAERAQNLTQLLGDPPRKPATPKPRAGATKQLETAATIAADDFSLTYLKREPQDADETDILGM